MIDKETIQIISDKEILLSKEVHTLLSDFSDFLNLNESSSKEPQEKALEIVEHYFVINHQYRDGIDTFIESLNLPSDTFSYLLGIRLNNILNEKHSEFRKLLNAHGDSFYINFLI